MCALAQRLPTLDLKDCLDNQTNNAGGTLVQTEVVRQLRYQIECYQVAICHNTLTTDVINTDDDILDSMTTRYGCTCLAGACYGAQDVRTTQCCQGSGRPAAG